jgi:hypothetical protein
VGTGGAWLNRRLYLASNSEVWAMVHGVVKLTLHADSYDWEFVSIAGQTFTDSGTGVPHGPPPPRQQQIFRVAADTWVDQGAPHTSHGSSSRLRVDGNHGDGLDYRSYLKVRVTGVSRPVFRAALRLWVTDATSDGPAIWRTSPTWKAGTMDWTNRPGPIGAVLDDAGLVRSGGWVDLDVTAAVTGDGLYSFLLRSTDRDGMVASSNEGAHPPRLVVETVP